MNLIQKIFKKLKYHIFIVSHKLFYSTYKGYNNLKLNKSIIKKTIIFARNKSVNKHDINVQRTIKFLEFIKKKKLKNILDFGGGAGYHYFIAKIKLPNNNLKWQVIENNTMVKLCNKKLNYRNLFFFDTFNKIKKVDVFFSSSAINYTKDPIKTIQSIIKLNAKYLYFTRTPLTENQSFRFKQLSLLSDNGPLRINNEKEILVEYENKILNIQNFETMFWNKYIVIKKYIDEKYEQGFFFSKIKFDSYTYILMKKN
jgi:putative methyltransferase (TIGR04325 family)